MDARSEAEKTAARAPSRQDRKLKDVGDAWDAGRRGAEAATQDLRRVYAARSAARRSTRELFGIARTLVRLAEETAKPNAERLREYREANLESLEQELFSEAPIYDDLETVKLADSLGMLHRAGRRRRPAGAEGAGRQVAAGAGRRAGRAARSSRTSSVRKKLAEGGQGGDRRVERPDDRAGPAGRRAGPRGAQDVSRSRSRSRSGRRTPRSPRPGSPSTGTDTYPDATFTLRLAFGAVKGYEEDGKKVPPWTTIGGAYERADGARQQRPVRAARELARSARTSSNLDTPFNFVCTADIIGGNSGSPVVNRDGEVVGLIFDGNIQSLVLDFVYTDEQARAVSVHSAGILEALRKVYEADRLVKEISPQK